jgi:YfiH family protein
VTTTRQPAIWEERAIGRERVLVHSVDGATMAFAVGPARGEVDPFKRLTAVARPLHHRLCSVAFCRQIHGSIVHRPTSTTERVARVGDGDALVTTTPGLGVAVWTADCVPILLAGPGVVAAVHSGWRGCAADVLGAAVTEIEVAAGLTAARLRVAIGPAVCHDCYEVGAEVTRALARFELDEERWLDGDRVDLRGFVAARLEALGVGAESIATVGRCTVESPELASYRRDGAAAGRQWSLVFLDR